MAGQGFKVDDFLWTEKSYRSFNKLAGNTVTTSVLGALVMGLGFGVLLRDNDGRCLCSNLGSWDFHMKSGV
jgi:hypothetical protein